MFSIWCMNRTHPCDFPSTCDLDGHRILCCICILQWPVAASPSTDAPTLSPTTISPTSSQTSTITLESRISIWNVLNWITRRHSCMRLLWFEVSAWPGHFGRGGISLTISNLNPWKGDVRTWSRRKLCDSWSLTRNFFRPEFMGVLSMNTEMYFNTVWTLVYATPWLVSLLTYFVHWTECVWLLWSPIADVDCNCLFGCIDVSHWPPSASPSTNSPTASPTTVFPALPPTGTTEEESCMFVEWRFTVDLICAWDVIEVLDNKGRRLIAIAK